MTERETVAGSLPAALPHGWAWTTLRQIAELKGGITKGQKRQPGAALRHVPYLRVANVQRGFLELGDVRTIEATEEEIAELRLQPGDVLFNEGGDRDKLGRGWVWRGQIPECIHQNHVFRARLVSKDICPEFVSWYGNYEAQHYFIAEGRQTTNLASINMTKLGALPVSLPPASEQRRIVEAIETQLTRLDAAVAALRRARANLKRYRAAVLKAACEGRLVPTGADTPSAPARSMGTPSEPEATTTSSLLPHSWRNVALRDLLTQPLSNGRSVPDAQGGFPVLRLTAIKRGRVDLTERKAGAWNESEARPFLVHRGDFLVARGNGSRSLVGRGGLVDVDPDAVAYPDTLIRVRTDDRCILPAFLRLVWDSESLRAQIESFARTTAGIYKINQEHLRGLIIPLPPMPEQRRIVAEVDRRFSVVEALEAAVEASLRRAERLRQSILKRAFEGKLVPQDPNDEPASVLLARIQAERAAAHGRASGKGIRRSRSQLQLDL